MRASRISIQNFRGIKSGTILLPKHAVLIGDNNTGKTSILEALDLTLGPDRLNRYAPINEHDFHRGLYLATHSATTVEQNEQLEKEDVQTIEPIEANVEPAIPVENTLENNPRIEIEVTVVDLSAEQIARFQDSIEFWDVTSNIFYEQPDPEGIDGRNITEALRVTFHGWYDPDEDDFVAKTYFSRSLSENDMPVEFRKKDKQTCGFLYLRSLRTGSRALSLERGSLLDIILRLKEVRPQMWEDTIDNLSNITVAADPALGISGVLESINSALKKYVPKEWGIEPHLKISNLTREQLRKVITAFIATGNGPHAAPFNMQGTGTINMLVLAMLSQIAADKQNVIFAMEEPETAIPPYAQKRIVHEIRLLASQAIFTSHSPFVLEEFTLDETVALGRDAYCELTQTPIKLPGNLKLKIYRQDFRTRFCEGLLSSRVLIAEGETEASAFPVACRRLSELNPTKYKSLEAMGICTLNAAGETKIPGMARLFRTIGKRTFALCDQQSPANQSLIEAEVDICLMHDKQGIEDLVVEGTTENALQRFAGIVEWPPHLSAKYPDPIAEAPAALKEYFSWSKGNWGLADFLAQCSELEMPEWLRHACDSLTQACDPVQTPEPMDASDQESE